MILVHHDGFVITQEQKKAESKADDELKIKIYNDIRAIAISWFRQVYKKREKQIRQSTENTSAIPEAGTSSDVEDLDSIPDCFIMQDHCPIPVHHQINEDRLQSYHAQTTLILDEWKKNRTKEEREQRRRNQHDNSSSNEAKETQKKNQMRKSLKRSIKQQQMGNEAMQLRQRRASIYPVNPWAGA